MKLLFSIAPVFILLSCNNQTSNASGHGASTDATVHKTLTTEAKTGDGCSNSILFRKGVVIEAATYYGDGKLAATQSSTVARVYTEKGFTVSELDMKSKNAAGKDEKPIKMLYKCDGGHFIMDMAGFMGNSGNGTTISATGLSFPFSLQPGQSLPDASYTMDISSGGHGMKITSTIKERKVEAKESITIGAGTYEAYKISSVVDVATEISTLTPEENKKRQEDMKKMNMKMRHIVWYAPEMTVLKIELYMGDKLQSRTEVTKITK